MNGELMGYKSDSRRPECNSRMETRKIYSWFDSIFFFNTAPTDRAYFFKLRFP